MPKPAAVIALLGAESTGKTTLAHALHAALATPTCRVALVCEYLREMPSKAPGVVLAPIGFGFNGSAYNINADHVALAIAKALNADALLFVTNVPGVKIDGVVVSKLTPDEAEAHIASSQISGGMVPKVRSAIEAIAAGVQSVIICDLAGFRQSKGTVLSSR